MRVSDLAIAIAAAASIGASAPVAASTCYALVDRLNEVTYQGPLPPVDLSDDGIAAREVVSSHGLIDNRHSRTSHILHAEIASRLDRSAECFEVPGGYKIE